MSRYMRSERQEKILAATVAVAFFAFLGGLWVVQSHFEAKAYERVTGRRVLLQDAMFLQLRVQEPTVHTLPPAPVERADPVVPAVGGWVVVVPGTKVR